MELSRRFSAIHRPRAFISPLEEGPYRDGARLSFPILFPDLFISLFSF